MRRPIAILICVLLFAIGTIVFDGLIDDVQRSDVGVVLGSKVNLDGTPSERLKARLDKAAELYKQGHIEYIIVSGGTGIEGFNEARVMADYLALKKAIPSVVILLDEHGDNTEATARNAAIIMNAHNLKSALVVTQYFHITRCRFALHRAGIKTVRTAHARYFELRDVYSTLRELIALPCYWISTVS